MSHEGPKIQILNEIEQARIFVRGQQLNGQRVAVVPTMGALHEGHLKLVDHANQIADITLATIFVNPTQFAPHEDLAKYPRTFESDLELLESRGAVAVFCPQAESMYPAGFSTYVSPPQVGKRWEGEARPDFFRGVATIVLKLFQIVPADVAIFGQKDFQQACVVKTMVRDLNIPIEIETIPIVREPDGLALSSRNVYLNAEERCQGLGLSRALNRVQDAVRSGELVAATLNRIMHETLCEFGFDKIDYAVVVDSETLEPISEIEPGSVAVALIAAWSGNTRLIDNKLLLPDASEGGQ